MLPFADLVLLTGTSSMAIVYGLILGIVLLGEKPNPLYDSATAFLILLGCVLTINYANVQEQTLTAEMVKERFTSPGTIIFFTVAGMIFFTTYIVLKK